LLLTFSATEEEDEIYNQAAFRSSVSRSKIDPAAEAEGGANDRRYYWVDRRLLGTGIFFSRSPQPDRKSFSDARSPLRVPGVGRAADSLTDSDFISKLKKVAVVLSPAGRPF
jgi:hypothetical protein